MSVSTTGGILSEVTKSFNNGDGSYMESRAVETLPKVEKINRLSAHHRPDSDRGDVRVLEL